MVDKDTVAILVGSFGLIMVGYWLLELHYFLRTLVCLLHAKMFKKKLHILDTGTYSSMCLTTDIDILLFHMNNARYLREVDFARTDFYNRTNLWNKIREKGGLVFQGGTNIRYRRFIKLFHLYYITSEILYWDQNSIYMEHRFITKKDNFVRAIVHCKQKVIKCNVEEIMGELLKEQQMALNKGAGISCPEAVCQKPDCPKELKLWIDSIAASSDRLRNHNISDNSPSK